MATELVDVGFLGERWGSCMHVASFSSARSREASAGPEAIGVPVPRNALFWVFLDEWCNRGWERRRCSSFKMKDNAFDPKVSP
jgi:hypothetical protein